MEKITLDFFGEVSEIKIPKSIEELRKAISEQFLFSPSDAAEIIISYVKDFGEKVIKTQQDLAQFLKSNCQKVLKLDISEESRIYKEKMQTFKDEDKLAELKKEREDILKLSSDKKKQLKEKIYELKKKCRTLEKELLEEERNTKTILKNQDKLISDLSKKLKKNNVAEPEIKDEVQYPKNNFKYHWKRHIKPFKCQERPRNHCQRGYNNFENIKGKIESFFGKEKLNQFINFCANQIQEILPGEKKEEIKNEKKEEKKVEEIKNEKEEEKKVVHKNFICDGCGAHPIIGTRFKCAVCDDFDYCEKCEETYKDIHQHPFIKINCPRMSPTSIKCVVMDNFPTFKK